MRRAAFLLLALAVPLAGCGRAGPPRPPGPKELRIYPRGYPKPDTPPTTQPMTGPSPVTPGGEPPGGSLAAPLGTSPGAAPSTLEVPPALR